MEWGYLCNEGINWYKKPYLKFNLNLVDSFLFPGKMAKEYHQFCGFNLNNENVFYAPNSVDSIFNITEREFNHKFNQNIKIRFLFIGSYIHLKSFDVLNDAFSYLTNKYEKYWISYCWCWSLFCQFLVLLIMVLSIKPKQ